MKSKDVDTGFAMNCPNCGEALRIMFNADGPEVAGVVIFDGLPLVDARVDKCPFCGAVLDSVKKARDFDLNIMIAKMTGKIRHFELPPDYEPEDEDDEPVN